MILPLRILFVSEKFISRRRKRVRQSQQSKQKTDGLRKAKPSAGALKSIKLFSAASFPLRIERKLEKARAYFVRILLCGRNGAIAVAGHKQLYLHRHL